MSRTDAPAIVPPLAAAAPPGQAGGGIAVWRLFAETFALAWGSLRAHRLRSGLTTLGVVIGTASVIAVVALLQGLAGTIAGQFAEMGGGVLSLQASNDFSSLSTGQLNVLQPGDIDVLRHRVDGVTGVAPILGVHYGDQVRYRGRSSTPSVLGTTADYIDVERRFPQIGRFIVPGDEQGHRRVAVIGPKLRDDLHLPANPVGEFIAIGGEWFKVVGVMEARGEVFGQSQDNYVLVPFEVGRALNPSEQKLVFDVRFTIADPAEAESVKERAIRAIRIAHHLREGQPDDFEVNAADQLARQFDKLTTIATLVLGGVVGISLLVGGIGIMTVMLISVTERTREIGIRKSLGATREDILLQFLLEAALLSLGGGLTGGLLGIVAAKSVAALIPGFPQPTVSFGVLAGVIGFSSLLGVSFGLAPALKASRLTPVEALRYE